VKVVSEMLGHASPDITMRIYQGVTRGMHRDAIEAYAAVLDAD
jgi:integrase